VGYLDSVGYLRSLGCPQHPLSTMPPPDLSRRPRRARVSPVLPMQHPAAASGADARGTVNAPDSSAPFPSHGGVVIRGYSAVDIRWSRRRPMVTAPPLVEAIDWAYDLGHDLACRTVRPCGSQARGTQCPCTEVTFSRYEGPDWAKLVLESDKG
jgi:hypothetical protein